MATDFQCLNCDDSVLIIIKSTCMTGSGPFMGCFSHQISKLGHGATCGVCGRGVCMCVCADLWLINNQHVRYITVVCEEFFCKDRCEWLLPLDFLLLWTGVLQPLRYRCSFRLCRRKRKCFNCPKLHAHVHPKKYLSLENVAGHITSSSALITNSICISSPV